MKSKQSVSWLLVLCLIDKRCIKTGKIISKCELVCILVCVFFEIFPFLLFGSKFVGGFNSLLNGSILGVGCSVCEVFNGIFSLFICGLI